MCVCVCVNIYITVVVGRVEEGVCVLRGSAIHLSAPSGRSAQRGKTSRILILFGPFYESLYVNPKKSKGFTSGARQLNPEFTESREWQ